MMITNLQTNYFINFQGRKKKNVNAKHEELAMRFAKEGLTVQDVEKAARKFSKLNNADPYSMEFNIREFVRMHKKDGLTLQQHLEAAKTCPSLFSSKPQTLSNHVSNLYEFASPYGITKEQIIELQNKSPVLRAMSSETLIGYMTDIPKMYRRAGLTEEEYVLSAFTDSRLIITSPKRFKNTIKTLYKHCSDLGVTVEDLINTFKKQREIVTCSPKNITEKIDSWKYIERNKLDDAGKTMSRREFKDLILRKNMSHSVESNLLYLLRCKLNNFYGTKMPAKKIKEHLTNFLRENADKTFDIPVLEGEFAGKFEKIVSDFSQKILNKNVFRVIVK